MLSMKCFAKQNYLSQVFKIKCVISTFGTKQLKHEKHEKFKKIIRFIFSDGGFVFI